MRGMEEDAIFASLSVTYVLESFTFSFPLEPHWAATSPLPTGSVGDALLVGAAQKEAVFVIRLELSR